VTLSRVVGRRWTRCGALLLLLAVLAPGAVALPAVSLASEGAAASPQLMDDPLGDVPADSPRMEAYAHGRYALFVAQGLLAIAVLCLIVVTGLGSYLEDVVEKLTRSVNARVAIYAVLLTVLTWLLALPLAAYGGFVREKRYGFANQAFPQWLADWGKELLITAIAQAIFFTLLYIVLRHMPRVWWIAGALLGIAFLIVAQVIAPVFLAPLFNTFTPLEDEALRDDILRLAGSQGIPAEEVYQVDASLQSEHSNAYVAGLFDTRRIVLYDTLLKRFAPREIRTVMGHEMGHYLRGHIRKTIVFLSFVIVAGMLLTDRLARRVISRQAPFGIRRLADPASMPLLLLILYVLLFVMTPALAAWSRAQESEADRFSLEIVGDPEAAASAFLKFGEHDLSEYNVHPLIEALLFSHPSTGRRIRMAQDYARAHPAPVPVEPRPATQAGPRYVAFLVVDGVYNSELVAPYDILQHVRFHSPDDWPQIVTVSPDGRPVTTFEGLRLTPDHSFATAPAIDVLVVPSAEHSMDADLENEALIGWVRSTGGAARHVMSLCDGAFVLARAGLLNGLSATTFPSDQDRFAAMFPRVDLVREVSFVDAGRALTSVGGAKSYEVALWLVERLYGAEVARKVGRGLVIDWNAAAVPHRVAAGAPR
jgi:STE24 endopeptidase